MNKSIKLLVVALASLGCTTAVLAGTSTTIPMKIVDSNTNHAKTPLLITVTYQTCHTNTNVPRDPQCYLVRKAQLATTQVTKTVPIDFSTDPKSPYNNLYIKKIEVNNFVAGGSVPYIASTSVDKLPMRTLFIDPIVSDGKVVAVGYHLQ